MTVDELIKELQRISDSGKGDYQVSVYSDCGNTSIADYISVSYDSVFIE